MTQDFVEDDEVLYRCVFYGKNNYKIQENCAIVSSQAFSDRNRSPSVDRAKLCNFDPIYTQKNDKDGVVSLIAGEVRLIDTITQNDPKGNQEFTYKIDILPRPTSDNPCHAQIEPSPEYRNQTPFRKLLERLAFLANQRGWEIEPYELRQDKNPELK